MRPANGQGGGSIAFKTLGGHGGRPGSGIVEKYLRVGLQADKTQEEMQENQFFHGSVS